MTQTGPGRSNRSKRTQAVESYQPKHALAHAFPTFSLEEWVAVEVISVSRVAVPRFTDTLTAMMERVKALIEQAKTLTAEERAELLDELSSESTEDIAKAWADEAVRRGDEATASGDRGEPWEVVRARLLA